MVDLFLDPFVLSCPSDADDEGQLERYLTSLLQWRDLAEMECIRLYTTARAAEVLTDTGGFPPWQRVRTLIERFDMTEELGPQDVFNVLQRFTDRSLTIEDRLGIDEILIDDVECVPDSHRARDLPFADGLERLLAMVCLLVELDNSPPSSQLVLTRGLGRCPERLTFKAVVHDVEGPSEERISCPRQLAGDFAAFGCSAQLRLAIDPLQLWEEKCYSFAIGVFAESQALAASVGAVPEWRLGSRFAASIEALHLNNRVIGQSILRACAKTILSQDMAAVHAIRIREAASSVQLKRGRDSAWRRDIDHEYHLHYWSTPAGPELASVVAHKDLRIPE
jgi:hypothetical protein